MYETAMHTKSNYIFLFFTSLYLIFASVLSVFFSSNFTCETLLFHSIDSIEFTAHNKCYNTETFFMPPEKRCRKKAHSMNTFRNVNDLRFTIDNENWIVYQWIELIQFITIKCAKIWCFWLITIFVNARWCFSTPFQLLLFYWCTNSKELWYEFGFIDYGLEK